MSAVSISYSHVRWANYRNHLLGVGSQVSRCGPECRSLFRRLDGGELSFAQNWSGSAGINFHPHRDLIDCYINYKWSIRALCSNRENATKFLTWLSAAACALRPIIRCIRVHPNVISRRQVLWLGLRTTTLQVSLLTTVVTGIIPAPTLENLMITTTTPTSYPYLSGRFRNVKRWRWIWWLAKTLLLVAKGYLVNWWVLLDNFWLVRDHTQLSAVYIHTVDISMTLSKLGSDSGRSLHRIESSLMLIIKKSRNIYSSLSVNSQCSASRRKSATNSVADWPSWRWWV